MSNPSRLAPQARPHALAELEVAIAKAEAERDRYRQSMRRASNDDELRRAKAFFRIAEQRLVDLRRSRAVLVSGEGQEEDDEQPSEP
jgi:hypothetical protein